MYLRDAASSHPERRSPKSWRRKRSPRTTGPPSLQKPGRAREKNVKKPRTQRRRRPLSPGSYGFTLPGDTPRRDSEDSDAGLAPEEPRTSKERKPPSRRRIGSPSLATCPATLKKTRTCTLVATVPGDGPLYASENKGGNC